MSAAPNAAAPPDLPDPQPDRPAAGTPAPSRTGRLLGVLRKLIDYGKQLAASLQQHASPANLAVVTRNFGTADIGLILAYITRALLRAAALEARLVSRGDRPDEAPARASTASERRRPRPGRPPAEQSDKDADPRVVRMPTPEKIAAQIRRRPAGAVLADICLDLGITTSHPLLQELRAVINANGGDFTALLLAIFRRDRKAMAGGRTGVWSSTPAQPALAPPALAPPPWPAPCAPLAPASGAGPP
ncbi:MAG TPA: hypothetical protein VND19_02935 [Acetobacteraceae bacterium]|nr:hypothetical protein [Acetobacteraceae bacterium]